LFQVKGKRETDKEEGSSLKRKEQILLNVFIAKKRKDMILGDTDKL